MEVIWIAESEDSKNKKKMGKLVKKKIQNEFKEIFYDKFFQDEQKNFLLFEN